MSASTHAAAASQAEAAPLAMEPAAGAATWRQHLGGPWTRPIATIGGAVLLVVAGFMPVWGTRLVAPQYPKGLELWFYGDRVEGPVREVNGLNHYIGMQSIDLSAVPEMVLWPLAVVGPALLLVMAVLWSGWLAARMISSLQQAALPRRVAAFVAIMAGVAAVIGIWVEMFFVW